MDILNSIYKFKSLFSFYILSKRNYIDDEIKLPADLICDLIVDVVVGDGTPWLFNHFSNQQLILIDPFNLNSEKLKLTLKNRRCELHECALGSKNKEININYDEINPLLSSIFKRTVISDQKHKLVKKKVQQKTLDEIIFAKKFLNKKIGLKIDTEGYELEILKGANKVLKNCNFIICEASIEKRFYNSYNFTELIIFMDKINFKLTKILRFAKFKNNINCADVLFQPK
jgi:FkbM family methyltransferase